MDAAVDTAWNNSTSYTATDPELSILPVANFTANPTEGSAPLTVQFTDTSSNSPIEWTWNFGDGTSSTEQNPEHTFITEGVYTVNLTASNGVGSSAVKSRVITVNRVLTPPVANFTANPTEGSAPLTVQFTDTSSNSPTEWTWNFGDGTSSIEQNPEHTFITEGVYRVRLTASNGDGSSAVKSRFITVNRVPTPPVADFSANPTEGSAPLIVQFTDTSSNSPTEWNWKFGDGASSTEQNPEYRFITEGVYKVRLTASNGDGSSAVKSRDITVNRVPTPPVADFTANTTEGSAPLTVQFTDTSSNSPIEWNWNFGDGTSSTEQNPEHTFIPEGVYTVRLTASNGDGSSAVKSRDITVNRVPTPPVADFSANPTEGSAPLTVQFTDTSSNSPTEWNWNFGDGANSTEQNPEHTFITEGVYTVNLTAINQNGTDSKTAVIAVLEEEKKIPPVADFNTNVTDGYAPLSVLFTDSSQDATSRSWDVNNDGIEDSNEASFVYVYTSTGTYTAKLTVSNANGTDSKTAIITVDKQSSGGSNHGGGGGSPEPSKNIEGKELSQVFITNGNPAKFNFTKEVTDVLYLSFDVKKTAGKITTIVEMLKNKSTLTPEAPEGEVYNFLNIWVGSSGYATETNIGNAVVCFRVEKSWMKDKGIDQSSIILNRYSDKKWNPLPTKQSGEDGKYLYFTAETPGFSPFAITGKSTAKETVTEILPEPGTQDPEQNENTKADVEQTPEQKEKTGVPGFEMIYCIIGLLGVFLYKRR